MKYILSFVGIVAIAVGIFFCKEPSQENNEEYVRIHISANSNSVQDQNIKYLVKDVVIEYLIPMLAEAENKDDALKLVALNVVNIKTIVEKTLKNEEVDYGCQISIAEEEVPTRKYGDLVVATGVYDCLKIDLGEAQGDNWWCLVFPAVCFVSSKNSENVEYISKIWEIINNVT